jgi:hypothetical protein
LSRGRDDRQRRGDACCRREIQAKIAEAFRGGAPGRGGRRGDEGGGRRREESGFGRACVARPGRSLALGSLAGNSFFFLARSTLGFLTLPQQGEPFFSSAPQLCRRR